MEQTPEILRRLAFPTASVEPLGNRGGFSGASLWRLHSDTGTWILKAWPEHDSAPQRVSLAHQAMIQARAAGLLFVPRLWPAPAGQTFLLDQGRAWEVCAWMPGRADFHADSRPVRLAAACVALSRLHRAWEGSATAGAVPAVRRRLEALRHWQVRRRAGWRPPVQPGVLAELGQRAWQRVRAWLDWAAELLRPWENHLLPLQICHCDPWHDHILFTGDAVTGFIDYAAVKMDHVSTDLARLLGSLVEDDESGWETGLKAYRSVRPLTEAEAELARVLDRTGAVVGLCTWLRRLFVEGRECPNPEAVAGRLATLLARVERW
jgi:homoserine kinase type II